MGSVLALSACTGALSPVDTDPATAPPTSATNAANEPSVGDDEELFILDNDWSLTGGGDMLILLADSDATVLGTTTTTGDAWAHQGTAAALSFLEAVGRDDVTVAEGQRYPLINTAARMQSRADLYGGRNSWMGVFNPSEDDPGVTVAPDATAVTEPVNGWAQSLAAADSSAADYMIEQVQAFPGRVTIVTTGPLTNVAAAIRQDPNFAATAKGIVIGGGNIEQMSPEEADAGFNSSEGFNFRFDPEAAHIALTAEWNSLVAVGDVTDSVVLDDALLDRVRETTTPASELMARLAYVGFPIWDETTAAVAAHPELITRSIPLRMDVDLSEGPNYGAARVWADGDSPGLGEQLVTFVQAVDIDGVADTYVDATHTTT